MPPRGTYHFGEFELDLKAFELRRGEQRIRLERRPMDLLVLLLSRPGELITRDEIVAHIWGADVFIDSESGVNTLVRKVRQALGDSSDAPRFIETVSGRGYRFVSAPVLVEPGALAASAGEGLEPAPAAAPLGREPSRAYIGWGVRVWIPALIVAVMAGTAAYWLSSGPSDISLAVLPFENISVAPGQEHLADALHEETIIALGHLDARHLRVVSRTATLKYRQSRKSPAEIGRELRVDYLVESTIRTEDKRVRITSSLIRVRDQALVWSSPYDYEPRRMLEFQRELSAAIAEQISLRLSPARLEALGRRHSRDAEAVDLYLRGQFYWNQLTPDTTERAIEYFRRSTARDPQYALPWAGIAVAYAAAPINADAEPLAAWPKAREAAERAIQANAALAEAQSGLGAVQFWLDWTWQASAASFARALDADPNYALAQRMVGIVRAHMGDHPGAASAMRRLRELEPMLAMNHALSAQVAFNARDFTTAVDHANQAGVVDPAFWIARYQAAQALEQLGEYTRALEMIAPVTRVNSKAASLEGYILAKAGRPADARRVLDVLETASATRYVPPYARALVHAGLGERDAALYWLERALDVHDVHLVALPVDAKWDAFRDDGRFAALLERCAFNRP